MTDLRPIPQYQKSLGDFVADLRNEIFSSQTKAAKHVGLDRSRVTRYEGGKYQPDVGYIAHLATLIAAKHESDEAIQEALLNEVSKTIRNCYQYEKPFRDWDELVTSGDAFIDERRTGIVPTPQTAVEPIAYNSSKRFWGISPDVSEFIGRESELETLQQWVVADHARMVGIAGIGGMGKTMVAKKVAQGVADHFEYVVWHSLRYPSPVEETMVDLIHFLYGENSADATQGLNQLLGQLMNFLGEHRCLLIIDNAETILAEGRYAGRYLSDYERYVALFSAICNTTHQSCLILTSREKTQELAHQSVRRNAKVHSIELEGVDVDVAQQVLDGTGLVGTEAEWTKLVQTLSGNLWALENTAASIGELYDGDIARFLEDTYYC